MLSHTYIQTGRQTDRQTGRQTNRKTDRQAKTHTYIIDNVLKIGLNTPCSSTGFFLRVKLWKVVMNCSKCFMEDSQEI